ncbi:MAG: tyrosine-protein phosphatase [Bacteroidaceae bacterium]|nr:tyrosine-protein phosphatase [Bacteroidaceae bacterium]
MKNSLKRAFAVALTICGAAFFILHSSLLISCSDDDQGKTSDVPTLEGTIVSYNEFGGAMVSMTAEDMTKAGFTLGDVLTITLAGKEITAPYYDGYYSPTGDYLFVAYPSYPSICFTANNVGLPEELMGLEGTPIVVKLKEKGGKLDVQQALSMKYTFERSDYPSDEAFANARAVSAGRLAIGRLHRTSSPFNNEISRAAYVSAYLEREQVKTVLNLADTEEMILGYDMPAYSRTLWESGDVILCPLKADPTAADFNNRLIAALKELPSHPAPYVVHCLEGKDRTGYVCALLEGLCGATYEEMVSDYLKTYENYFFITPAKDPAVCNALVTLRLNMCLKHYAGVDDEAQLPSVDYAAAFSRYLLAHGMSQAELDALVQALTS